MSDQKLNITRRQAIRGSAIATLTAATAMLAGCMNPRTRGAKRRAARRANWREREYMRSIGG